MKICLITQKEVYGLHFCVGEFSSNKPTDSMKHVQIPFNVESKYLLISNISKPENVQEIAEIRKKC